MCFIYEWLHTLPEVNNDNNNDKCIYIDRERDAYLYIHIQGAHGFMFIGCV